MSKSTIELVSKKKKSIGHTLGCDFVVNIDGIQVSGKWRIVKYKEPPQVSYGHSGEYAYRVKLDNPLVKKSPNYEAIRIQIIKLTDYNEIIHSDGADVAYLYSIKKRNERNKTSKK